MPVAITELIDRDIHVVSIVGIAEMGLADRVAQWLSVGSHGRGNVLVGRIAQPARVAHQQDEQLNFRGINSKIG